MKRIIPILAIVFFFSPIVGKNNPEQKTEEKEKFVADKKDPEIDRMAQLIQTLDSAYNNNDKSTINRTINILINDYDIHYSTDLLSDSLSSLKNNFDIVWDSVITECHNPHHREYNASRLDGILGKYRDIKKEIPLVFTYRIKLKSNSAEKYVINGRNMISIAVVPESGGKVTMRIHAYDRKGFDKRWDDSEQFHQGKRYRKRTISLPKNPTTVDVEIINHSERDISAIVIARNK